ncbi:hypothetical protein I203_107347 [Kwoniella mangroviensis CBS 8507]|uniref:hypothetical protein n=1 Tax=Kwoniella mangroviensis CBS 8507 TaxID=1296122 RepID=UPI00302D9512
MKSFNTIPFLIISILTILVNNNIINVKASPASYRGRSPKLPVNFSGSNEVEKRQSNDTGGGFSWGHDPMRGVNIGGCAIVLTLYPQFVHIMFLIFFMAGWVLFLVHE